MKLRRALTAAVGIPLIVGFTAVAASTHAAVTAAPASRVTPLNNNGSAGSVVLTFDDGPDIYDASLLSTLNKLHLHAVFFVIGDKITPATQSIIREEVADGDLVENHTWDHADWTGTSTGTAPLTNAQVTAELSQAQAAIVAAGAPAPKYARAPFGDLNGQYAIDAANLGLQMVQPFEVNAAYAPRIVNSNDWSGISAAQITEDVTEGSDGDPGIDGGSIIGYHDAAPYSCASASATTASTSAKQHIAANKQDGLCSDVQNTIDSLQGLVKYLNAHHLGVTTVIPSDATGGILGPQPWPWLPTP
jgi:peptidoglycan/xylan/chitin deacetylase (PgdA/CDA1 family)